jgi:ketosteroid isomerase-like protein
MRLSAVVFVSLAAVQVSQPATPQQAVDELLAADRAFSSASAGAADVIAGLSPMFADDVAMPIPPGKFTTTKAEAAEAMRTNPDNLTGTASWTPIRGGISADGQHGFTFGYMTVRRADGSEIPVKYLAYWVKTPEGWRVAVYRRRQRGGGPVSMTALPASLPKSLMHAHDDAVRLESARGSLAQAEIAFSTDAQSMGLGAAFTKWGRADAVNMGPPDAAAFIVGAEAIGKSVGAGTPTDSSPVSWSPDRAIVASSGDLGVTLGMIRPNDGKGSPVPFFTIWRRESASAPWRYIAE